MSSVTEIAPDVYRISTFIPEADLQFNQFLINDDEPLLFHTGMKVLFPVVRESLAKVMDPSRIRWIGFSHSVMQRLAALKPRTILPMHGSTYVGDGERALRELAVVMREVLA